MVEGMRNGAISGFLRFLCDRQYRRDVRRKKRTAAKYRKWLRAGRPVPPPHYAKQLAVLETAREFRIGCFIETGTFKGDMVRAMLQHFQRLYSIELDKSLCQQAQERFAGEKHVSILQGDSAKVLPSLLEEVRDPCLFWLDGHYSGDNTSRGDVVTPVFDELAAILGHHVRHHVILIDDARLFVGSDGYPKIEAVMDFIAAARPDYVVSVKDDIIRALPGQAGAA